MATNGGLFDFAGKSVGDTQNSILAEQEMANGRLKIDGIWYDSIDDYISGKPSENQEGNEPPTDEDSGLPYTSGTRPYFPNTDFIQVEGTNLNNGLVIQDKEQT